MKITTLKTTSLRTLMACLFALLTMQTFAAPKNKTIDYPLIDFSNTFTIDIAKVELTKKATILHVDARYEPNYWIRIASGAYLKADGKKYMLTGADGIKPDSLFWMPESGEASFTLRFEPMPQNTQKFDFIEGDSEGAFKLFGIDLTGKKTYGNPDNLPGDVANVAVPDTVPAPILECGKTNVRVHLLDYRQEYDIKSINIYVNTIFGKQEELEVKIDPKSGNGEMSFQQYGSAFAFLTTKDSSIGSVWLAPGETIDVYADLRSMRYLYKMHISGKKNAPQNASFQRIYTNGTYAGLNRYVNEINDNPYYTFALRTGEFADYRMTSAEYAGHVINTYRSLVDSVNVNCRSLLDKEYQTLLLKQEACVAMSHDLREHNYRSVNRVWRGEIPAGSIDPLKPEDAQKICALFDINDKKLLMGSDVLDFVSAVCDPRVDWMNVDSLPDGLLRNLRHVGRLYGKAVNAQLDDADFALLKSMDTPFFYDAFSQMQADAKKVLASMEGKIEKTPDVPVEQLFDAIVASHKGKVMLIDFWNTWCGPCRAAIKNNEPYKRNELKSDDLVWIYIANETSPMATYLNMIPNIQGIHYRLNAEQWRYITGKKFDIDGIPSYVMVDKSGRYELRNDFRDHDKLVQTLQKALAE